MGDKPARNADRFGEDADGEREFIGKEARLCAPISDIE